MKLIQKTFSILLVFLIVFDIPSLSFADSVSVNSKAAILVEVSTGKILFEKNSTQKLYPASTTKIMTAILVLENSKLDDKVTVSSSALENIPAGYVTCNLQVGEELTVEDLLNALLIPSANDAAFVLAEYIGGSIEGFANMMNAKALELGCKNTHFVNPNGIHNEAHYSTANDMYLIANYAMKNEDFKKIVCKTTYTLPATNKYPTDDRVLTTTNDLLNPSSSKYYYKNAIGIKTGYTSEAGNCLVSESSRDGLEFISVTLGGRATDGLNDRFTDAKKLFDFAYDNFTLTKLNDENSIIKTIEIENATKETKNLDILIKDSITVINNKETDTSQILPDIKLNENLVAPISAGDEIGSIKYTIDNVEYSSKLLAGNDVIEKPDLSIYFIICGIILLIIGFMMIPKKNKKQKKLKRTKKSSRR